MSGHPRSSRPKPPPPGKPQVTGEINLGEFQNADTLTYSEASLVLNALMAKRRNDRKDPNATEYVSNVASSHSCYNLNEGRRSPFTETNY